MIVVFGALGAIVLSALVTSPVPPPSTLPRCLEADVRMIARLDSARSIAGDSFAFKITKQIAAHGDVPEIPLGTRGYGIVSFADHAHGAGTPGRLVIEPRFLELSGGAHVPVMADPQLTESFVTGATKNVNGAFGFVPGFGLAIGGYNALHRGKEIVIEKGTTFRVVLGDDLAAGTCFVPPPDAPDLR